MIIQFEIWAGQIKLGDTYKFELNFVEVHLTVEVFGPLKWQASSETAVKMDSIKIQTYPILLHPSSIIFELTKTSHTASLYLRYVFVHCFFIFFIKIHIPMYLYFFFFLGINR